MEDEPNRPFADDPRPLLELFPPVPSRRAQVAPPPPGVLAPPVRASVTSTSERPGPIASNDLRLHETFYGFDERPFSGSTDPRFLYHSASHDGAAQTLLSAIGRRDRLVVLTGPDGIGKTIVARAVLDEVDQRTLTSYVPGADLTASGLLEAALIDFSVVSRDELARGRLPRRDDRVAALREFLIALTPLQAFAVLIVDDAESVSTGVLEEVRALVQLDGDHALLQVVLIGTAGVDERLAHAELRALAGQVSARWEIGPLLSDEIDGYVAHRIALAGPHARIQFDGGAIDALYRLSGGVPRTINVLCDRALVLAHEATASVVDADLIDRAAGELSVEPRQRGDASRLGVSALAFAMLVLLMLCGAAAAAMVFHERTAELVTAWETIPMPPRPPALRTLAPLYALPPPVDAASENRR